LVEESLSFNPNLSRDMELGKNVTQGHKSRAKVTKGNKKIANPLRLNFNKNRRFAVKPLLVMRSSLAKYLLHAKEASV